MSLTATQLAERSWYCGASEVAAALGMSRHTSRLELWLKKVNGHTGEQTDAMAFGHALEAHVLDRFEARAKPRAIIRPTEADPLEYASLTRLIRCHLDGLMVQHAVVNAKTARSRDGFGEPGTDAVPQEYLLQEQVEMALTGLDLAYLPTLFRDDLKLEVYEVVRDDELIAMISDGVAEFWEFVARREPPPPDFESRAAVEVIRKVFKGTNGQTLQASPCDELYYRTICDAQEKASNYSSIADSARAHLLWTMGEAAALTFSDGRVLRRKLVSRKGYVVEPAEYVDARIVKA
jgi:predicted phage-related endonuclease